MRGRLLSLVVSVLPALAASGATGEWQQVHPEVEASGLVGVVHDAGRWAVVAWDGTILESEDGLEWAVTGSVDNATSTHPVGIAYGGGSLVVVSSRGAASVRTPAGAWIGGVSTGVRRAVSLGWDGDRFIVLGDDERWHPGFFSVPPENALIATSHDGLEWTVQAVIPDGSTPGHGSIAVAGDARIAVGVMMGFYSPSGGGEVDFALGVSNDGVTWEVVTGGPNLQMADWTGDRFLAMDSGTSIFGGRGPFLTSRDGRTWEETGLSTLVNLRDLACSAGRCLGVGASSLVEVDLLRGSVVEVPGPPGLGLRACSCSDDRCVVVAEEGTILVTEVPGAWRVARSGRVPDLAAVAEHDGTWVAVGSPRYPSSSVLYSHDGIAWQAGQVPDPAVALTDVAWAGGAFAAVANGGLILESAGGAAWRRVASPVLEPLRAVAGNGQSAVAVGGLDRGVVLRRAPSGEWRELPMRAPPLHDVAWDGRRYLVAGDTGTLLESPDGREWTTLRGLAADDLRWLASNGHRLFVGGDQGTLTTVDGVSWQPAASAPASAIDWTGRGFMATSQNRWSPDGLTWGSSGMWVSGLTSAHSAAGTTVAVGGRGRVIRRAGPTLVDAPGPWKALIPVLASTDGRGGSTWSSELWVGSLGAGWPSTPPTALLLDGAPSGGRAEARDLPVERFSHFRDPLAGMFGRPESVGALLLAADEPHLLGASVVGSSGSRHYRQLVPAARIDDDRAPQLLPLLGATAATRVNLALVNPHGQPVETLLEVVADDGVVRGRLSVWLAPWSSRLVTDVVRRATGGDELSEPLLRVVPLDGRPAPVSLASIVDIASGDPITVTPAAVTDEALAVPVVAHNPGFGASLWRSDLMLHNPGPFAARFRLEMRSSPDWQTVHTTPWLQLAAGASVRYRDVVERLFGLRGTGWLRVALSSGCLAGVSRTYDVAAPSPLGHPVPAIDEALLGGDDSVWAVGLRLSRNPNRGLRTKVGVTHVGRRVGGAVVDVVRAEDGARLKRLNLPLRDGQQRFVTLRPGPGWFPAGRSEVEVVLEARILAPPGYRGSTIVFGSTVDAATGDAQLVVAGPAP